MSKWNFKPLLLCIPFVCLIGVCAIIDHPLEEKKTYVADTEESTHTTEEEKTAVDPLDEYEHPPIDPIMSDKKRNIPKDAKKISLAVGVYGSMSDGAGDYIYTEPDEESQPLAQLQYHSALVLSKDQEEDDWYKVELIGEDTEGYVKKESAEKVDIAIGDKDDTRNGIVRDALKYLGIPFKQKNMSLDEDSGVDCSFFTHAIYDMNGVDIPDSPVEQSKAGSMIEDKDAQPGDIVFYQNANQGKGHVAIYLGDGIIIHSSGHSGKTYPEGGVHFGCLLYPDRDVYQIINILDQENDEGEEDE